MLQFISWDRHRKHVLAPASIVGSVSSEAFQTAFGIINEALQFPQGVLLILGKGSKFSKQLQHHVNRCFLQMRMKRLHPKIVTTQAALHIVHLDYPRRIFHEKARRKTQTSNSQLSFATRCLTTMSSGSAHNDRRTSFAGQTLLKKFFLKDQRHNSIFKRPESLVEHVSTLVQTKTFRGKPQSKMTNIIQHLKTIRPYMSKVCAVQLLSSSSREPPG